MHLAFAALACILSVPASAATSMSGDCNIAAALSAMMCATSGMSYCASLLSANRTTSLTIDPTYTVTTCAETVTGTDGEPLLTTTEYV